MAGGGVDDVASRVDDLERRVRRLADRMRGTSLARLAAPLPPHASRARAATSLAAVLAAAAQGVEERTSPTPPDPHVLSAVGAHAVGDVVAVTGHDLVRAAREALADRPGGAVDVRVWRGSARVPLPEVVEAARAAVTALLDAW